VDRNSRIFVAGHRGLVGSALVRRLRSGGYRDIVAKSHVELDLTNQADVNAFFSEIRPECVFMAAGRVGGILANSTYPAEFIQQNLAMEVNVITACHRSGVKKLLFPGSSCIYPRLAAQPIREENLLSGNLEPTNEAYAVAKIAGIKMCAAFNRQYGTDFLCVMPTNLYGPEDHYDLDNCHVLPALIRKMHEARTSGSSEVVVWGSGRPRREFLHSDDLADACVFLMERYSAAQIGELVNIGAGRDISIAELARLIAEVVGFTGQIRFDAGKPDGMPQKLLDVSRLASLGWSARIGLREGIADVYSAYAAASCA
jgi:GDP-L-fucose synthase